MPPRIRRFWRFCDAKKWRSNAFFPFPGNSNAPLGIIHYFPFLIQLLSHSSQILTQLSFHFLSISHPIIIPFFLNSFLSHSYPILIPFFFNFSPILRQFSPKFLFLFNSDPILPKFSSYSFPFLIQFLSHSFSLHYPILSYSECAPGMYSSESTLQYRWERIFCDANGSIPKSKKQKAKKAKTKAKKQP